MPRPPAPFDPKRDRRKEKNYEKVLELPVPMPVVKTGSAEPKPEIGDAVIDMFNDDDMDCFII